MGTGEVGSEDVGVGRRQGAGGNGYDGAHGQVSVQDYGGEERVGRGTAFARTEGKDGRGEKGRSGEGETYVEGGRNLPVLPGRGN